MDRQTAGESGCGCFHRSGWSIRLSGECQKEGSKALAGMGTGVVMATADGTFKSLANEGFADIFCTCLGTIFKKAIINL